MVRSYIHETAIVLSDQVGEGTRIWAYTHVLPHAVIGKHCNFGDHVFVENDVKVGDHVTVKNGTYLWDGITLGDGVFIGPLVAFTNDARPRSGHKPRAFARTVVERGASIGANATVVAPRVIGAWSMIGAGSVVTRDVPAHAKVLGNPARVVGFVCHCGGDLDFEADEAECCGVHYRLHDNSVVVSVRSP